jgi:hypothetical protein
VIDRLLPPNATELERHLDQLVSRLAMIEPPISKIWNPWSCPVELLPWLAWAEGVDEWDANWPEDVKRQMIAAAPEIRRHRGSVWAVREALKAAGYGDSELIEGMPAISHNGKQLHDGADAYSGDVQWAHFGVITDLKDVQSVSAIDISRALRLIDRAKNVRSVLHDFGFRFPAMTDALDSPTDAVSIDVTHSLADSYDLVLRYNAHVTHSGAERYGRDAVTLLISASPRYGGTFNYNANVIYSGRADTAVSF